MCPFRVSAVPLTRTVGQQPCGQGSVLQLVVSLVVFDSNRPSMSLHTEPRGQERVRVVVPVLHDLEHEDHGVHGDQWTNGQVCIYLS